ncbi:MAG: tail fiber domain-containing protein, partial [Paracoccaceae bacterium]|nr:tail fiber domain-containing protein [Paracoccaceae bacterium]
MATAIGALCLMTTGAQAQDLVVDGSLCVGFDCPANPGFGFDTIRLQENNLRIHFDDTSVAAAFPRNDWGFQANDSANGGDSYMAILDRTANRQVLRVDAGTRSNSLYIDSAGDVGFGTSTPVVELHAVRGDTPTLRLEQDGSSGFTPQTWDVAGNEANFFIRDVTNGSALPIRIQPGTASNTLYLDNDELIGIRTSSPSVPLHLVVSGTAQAAPNAGDDVIIQDDGAVRFALINTSPVGGTNEIWTFTNNNTMRLSAGTDDPEFVLDDSGNLTILGALTEFSDKHAKMAIEPVSPDEILAKVTALPIAEWTYKHDAEAGTRHIGPMAQDFYAAFGTGA